MQIKRLRDLILDTQRLTGAALSLAVPSSTTAVELIHDADYYVLKAQHG